MKLNQSVFREMTNKTLRITVMYALKILNTLNKLCKAWIENKLAINSWLWISTLVKRIMNQVMDLKLIQLHKTWHRHLTQTFMSNLFLMMWLKSSSAKHSQLRTLKLYLLNLWNGWGSSTTKKFPHINLLTFCTIPFKQLKKPSKLSINRLFSEINLFL